MVKVIRYIIKRSRKNKLFKNSSPKRKRGVINPSLTFRAVIGMTIYCFCVNPTNKKSFDYRNNKIGKESESKNVRRTRQKPEEIAKSRPSRKHIKKTGTK